MRENRRNYESRDHGVKNFRANKRLSKRVKVFIAVGAVAIAASVAIAVVKPWENSRIEEPPAIVQVLNHKFNYTVKYGENFWNIASRYVNENEIDAEASQIAEANNLDLYAPLKPGTNLKLNIPYDILQTFLGDEFIVEFVKASEWEAKDYYIWQSFSSQLNEEGELESQVEEAKNHFKSQMEFFTERLRDVARLRYNYEEMVNDPFGFYNEKTIKQAEANITYLYNEMIEDLKNNSFTSKFRYGTDFVLPDNVVISQRPSKELTPEKVGREPYTERAIHAYTYQVKDKDNLWKIAGMYCDTDGEIQNEVEVIASLNGIDPEAILPLGKMLTLNIPQERVQEIVGSNYSVSFTEPDEMESYAYFIEKALTFTNDANLKGEVTFRLGTAAVLKSQYDNVFGEEADNLENEILQIYISIIEDLKKHSQTSQLIYGYDFVSPQVLNLSLIELPELKK